MENKKVLIIFYVSLIALLGCNNQNKKSNQITVEKKGYLSVICQKDTPNVIENLVLKHIENFFQQEGTKRNIKFSLVSQDTITPQDTLKWKKISHVNGLKEEINKRFTSNTSDKTIIVLSSLLFDSAECSKQFIHDNKINNDSLIKIPYFAFRIDSCVYTIFVTSDIEHIRSNIFRNCKEFFELNENDCYP